MFYLKFQKNPKKDKGRSNFFNTTPSTKYHFIQGTCTSLISLYYIFQGLGHYRTLIKCAIFGLKHKHKC